MREKRRYFATFAIFGIILNFGYVYSLQNIPKPPCKLSSKATTKDSHKGVVIRPSIVRSYEISTIDKRINSNNLALSLCSVFPLSGVVALIAAPSTAMASAEEALNRLHPIQTSTVDDNIVWVVLISVVLTVNFHLNKLIATW